MCLTMYVAGWPPESPGSRLGFDGESGVFRIALHLLPKSVQLKERQRAHHMLSNNE